MSATKLDPNKLTWVHLNDRNQLPTAGGVYFAIDRTGKCLYVGSTTNLRQRLKSHHRMFDFCKLGVEKLHWQHVKTEHLIILRKLEEAYIEVFQPLLNTN